MSPDNRGNEVLQIILGILLLCGFHLLAFVIIYFIGYFLEVNSRSGSYVGLQFWIVGIAGFLFWQLIYVIPLCILLQRRGLRAMRDGVVICAAITALLNGGCFLWFGTVIR